MPDADGKEALALALNMNLHLSGLSMAFSMQADKQLGCKSPHLLSSAYVTHFPPPKEKIYSGVLRLDNQTVFQRSVTLAAVHHLNNPIPLPVTALTDLCLQGILWATELSVLL